MGETADNLDIKGMQRFLKIKKNPGIAFMPMWQYEIIHLLRQTFNRGELALPKCLEKTGATKTAFNGWLNPHYEKSWIVHFARPSKNHHRNIKYPGRYLKCPALSMSRLKHYDGREVIFSYLNHTTKQYLRFTSRIEDFIKRLVLTGIVPGKTMIESCVNVMKGWL